MFRPPSRSRGRARRGAPALVLLPLALLTLVLAACSAPSDGPPAPAPSTLGGAAPGSAVPSASSASSTGDGTVTCEYPAGDEPARPVDPPPTTGVPATGTVTYTLALTGGPVTVTLDRGRAPCTVNSFVSLADQGYFDKTRCHRLVDSGIFLLQCGDPTGTGSGSPGYTFADETTGSESYTTGVVAMANSGPDTNGSQFFLVWDDSTALDERPNYTIFGSMDTPSRDVVAQMAGEGQDGSNSAGGGRPNNPSEISKVTKG